MEMSDTDKAVLMEDLDEDVMLVDVIDAPVVGLETDGMKTALSDAVPTSLTYAQEEDLVMETEIVSIVPMGPSTKTPARQISKSKGATQKTLDDLHGFVRTYRLDFPFKYGYVARLLLNSNDSFTAQKLIQYLNIFKISKVVDEQRLLEYLKSFRKQFEMLVRHVSLHSKEVYDYFEREFKMPFLLEESPVDSNLLDFEMLSTEPQLAIVSSFVYQSKPAVSPTPPLVHSEPHVSNISSLVQSNHTVSTGLSSVPSKKSLLTSVPLAQSKHDQSTSSCSAQSKQVQNSSSLSAYLKSIVSAPSAQPEKTLPAPSSLASEKTTQGLPLLTISSRPCNLSSSCIPIPYGSTDSVFIPKKAKSLHSKCNLKFHPALSTDKSEAIWSAASKSDHLKSASHSSLPSLSQLVPSSADIPLTRTSATRIECSQCLYKKGVIKSLRRSVAVLELGLKNNRKNMISRRPFHLYDLIRQVKQKEASATQWKRKFQRNKINVGTMKMMSFRWVTSEQKLEAAVKKCQELFLQTEELQSQLTICKNQLNNFKKEMKEAKKISKERGVLLRQVDELRSSLEAVKAKCKKEHVKTVDWDKGKYLIDKNWDERHDSPECHPDLQKIIYKCMMHKLTLEACEDIIQYTFMSLSGRLLRHFPKMTALRYCNLQLSVLADLHVGNCLYHDYDAATITLHTIKCDSQCINQVHVTSPSGQKMKIDLTIIPGGEPEDNFAHVSQTLLDIIEIFCPFVGRPGIAVKDVLLRKIKKSELEKAKVHNFVVRRLKEEFYLDLLELKCSVHPLDGFAQAAKTTLARMDRKWELSTTEDSSLVDVMIYNVVKMRYCSNVGDPRGFHSFIKEKKLLNKGFNVRYMGNRPSGLFHMSAAVYNIRSPLVEYLSQIQKKKLAARILEVLKDPCIEIQLQCMALFSMFLCVPWMREFCKSAKDNTQAVKEKMLKICMVALARVVSEPDLLFTTQTDVFGDPLELEESILQDVQSKGMLYLYHAKKYQDCIVELATAFSDTLQILVVDNLQCLFPEAAEALLAATSTAVPYKGDDLRILGLVDAVWRRAPHANVAHLNGKFQARFNKTIEWLDSRTFTLSNLFLRFAECCIIKSKLFGKPKKRENLSNLKVHIKKKKCLEKLIDDSLKKSEDVISLSCFESLDNRAKNMLQKFVVNDSALSNRVLRHVWHDEGEEVTYLELIKCVDNVSNSNGDVTSRHVFLYYWKEGEDTANTYLSLKMSRFLADFAAGDLVYK